MRSGTGQPRCQETPVIRSRRPGPIRETVPWKLGSACAAAGEVGTASSAPATAVTAMRGLTSTSFPTQVREMSAGQPGQGWNAFSTR